MPRRGSTASTPPSGSVTGGQDVVEAIQHVDRDGRDRPVEPVTMEKVTVSAEVSSE